MTMYIITCEMTGYAEVEADSPEEAEQIFNENYGICDLDDVDIDCIVDVSEY